MPMPRFPNSCFPRFCQFCMEEKKFAVEMKTLNDFSFFLMHIRQFEVIFSPYEADLLGIYMSKVDNKSSRIRYKTYLKLKLKNNKHTRMTLSNGVVVFIVNFERISNLILVFLLLTLNI